MTQVKDFIALSVAMAFVAVSPCVCAQDDLDNLLKDLEGEVAKPADKSAKPVSAPAPAVAVKGAKPASVPEVKAEKPVPAAPVAKPAEKPAPTPAPAVKEEKPAPTPAPVPQKKVDEVLTLLDELANEGNVSNAAPATARATPVPAVTAAPVAAPASQAAVSGRPALPADPDAELISNIRATEKLRREALDVQAKREIAEARRAMNDAEYGEAVRHYGLALRLLNDRPSSLNLRRECDQGVAEGLYRAALQEWEIGRRERAMKLIEKAIDMRHPKARRMLERWNSAEPDKPVDLSEIKHRNNDDDYKSGREQIRRHLKRSIQYLAVRDLTKALEECEIVLVKDPSNREAIRVREAIEQKRRTILRQERTAARDGWIADVDEKWRPVYAVNAAQLKDSSSETVKQQTGDDPERTMEQEIERRMKEMRLPTISFKPPATIIDAVEFFRGASKDYDRPDIPVEKRGFNFLLKPPRGALKAQAAAEESDDFSSNAAAPEKAGASAAGLPPIPTIVASDISFYEALKLVCDSVDYKFIIRGSVVTIMHRDMSTAELLSRKYDVLDAFLERMTSASADIKQMKSAGFGGGGNKKQDEGEENQERDWKAFFEQMGVKWPEGSSIMYIKTLGKLYVRNTRENLAEFEKVLQEMGTQPKLIEIETRFVEVSQEDLNSLGFEWILNSDYSLDVGSKLGKALGINKSTWGSEDGSRTWTRELARGGKFDSESSSGTKTDSLSTETIRNGNSSGSDSRTTETVSGQNANGRNFSRKGTMNYSDNYQRSTPYVSKNGGLIRDAGSSRNIGINAFGGTDSDYNRGNRYLSDIGNHISGQDASNNDQFMRVNAFLGAADLSMILHMLAQRSDTDLLSAPKIVTKSGENAVIKVVTEYIYPQDYDVQLQSSSSSGGYNGGSQSAVLAVVEPQNFQMREVGVILDVTPTYSEANGGTIDLELKPSVIDEPIWHNYGMKIPFTGNTSSSELPDLGNIISSMTGALSSLGENLLSDDEKREFANRIVNTSMGAIDNLSNSGKDSMTWYEAPMEQPFFHVRSIDSKVSITPGSTVVMGGLITESRKAMDDKIPFLGDLPFVGRLFRSHAEQTVKKNLLIFVTGRLITPAGRELTVNEETAETAAEVKPAPKAE